MRTLVVWLMVYQTYKKELIHATDNVKIIGRKMDVMIVNGLQFIFFQI